MFVFLNDKYLQHNEANISIDDRGFHFGDGIYDIMLLHNGVILDDKRHFERTKSCAEFVKINFKYSNKEITAIVEKLCEINKIQNGKIILVASRGSTDRWDVDFSTTKPNFLIYIKDADNKISQNQITKMKIKITEDIRWKFRNIKTACLLPSVIARIDASSEGFDDVVYIENGFVNEISRSNIFIVKEANIITPPDSEKILSGITMKRIIDLMANISDFQDKISNNSYQILYQMNIIRKAISIEELLNADEVFASSATMRIGSISKIDHKDFTESKVANALLELYDSWVINH
jgi:D-alanine transaminase